MNTTNSALREILAQQINISPTPPPGSDKILELVNVIGWIALVGGVVAIVLAGALMGYEKWQSGGDAQTPKKIMFAIVGGVISSIAGSLMAFAWS